MSCNSSHLFSFTYLEKLDNIKKKNHDCCIFLKNGKEKFYIPEIPDPFC